MKLFFKLVISSLLLLFLVAMGFYLYYQSLQPKTTPITASSITFSAKRLSNKPIISNNFHPRLIDEAEEYGYTNINGPSLIRVPDWLPNPLGTYYLYFAHHKGTFLRMAYADSLAGPWTMYDEEILPLANSGLPTEVTKNEVLKTLWKYNSLSENIALYTVGAAAKKAFEERNQQKIKSSAPTTPHIASPEVIIDEENHQIRLYFHGVVEGVLQKSKVALSNDGIHFEALPEIISLPYLRIFPHQNQYYGLAMPGFFYRSQDGLQNFEVRKRWLFDPQTRHFGLWKKANDLYVFYTRVGDAPERIFYTRIDISSTDWNDWKTEVPAKELIRPELEWEGAKIPPEASTRGEMGIAVNQLRDPDIFEGQDGKLYLLYTGAGEQGIGIAELNIN